MTKKLLLVGPTSVSSLEQSYARAGRELGYEVQFFNPDEEIRKHVKLGKFGQKLHQFLPVDAWVRKMNRELVIRVKNEKPDYLLVFTSVRILYGTLAVIKTISETRIVWIWPDTPMNLAPHNLEAAGLYDFSAVYSEKAIPVFSSMGFKNPAWVALAGDPLLHGCTPRNNRDGFDSDISFVGMWRPERERMLNVIAEHFPQLRMEIYGSYWKDRCGNRKLIQFLKGSGIVGKDLGNYFNRCKINLNVIDDTNYPAANMRFFEIPTAGGLQLSSPCPEQESNFVHRREIVFFTDEQDLVSQVQWILDNEEDADRIRVAAHRKLNEAHTYAHRLKQIISRMS